MTNSEQAIREFAEKQHPENWELAAQSLFNQIQRSSQAKCLSDLTALISEGYYPKEFVRWTFRQRFMSCGHLDFDSSILDLDLEYWHKHIKGKENEQ